MSALRNRDPRLIGIIALTAGALVVGLVVTVSRLALGHATYKAHFEQTAGLRVGEDVMVAGVAVGEIRSIELGKTDVLVTFTVEDGIRLGSKTTAEIKVATLLGTHYLSVQPSGTDKLASDTIPRDATKVPYSLQDVIDRGSESLDELDPVLLSRTLNQAGKTLDASRGDVRPALEGITRVSDLIVQRSDQAGELLDAASTVASQLNANSGQILQLMRNATLVLNEVQSRRSALRQLLADAQRIAAVLKRTVRDNDDDLRVALVKLEVVTKALLSQDKQLSEALRVLGPSARYLANATGNGPWVDARPGSPLPDGAICQSNGTC